MGDDPWADVAERFADEAYASAAGLDAGDSAAVTARAAVELDASPGVGEGRR